jgi:hypothetical protein
MFGDKVRFATYGSPPSYLRQRSIIDTRSTKLEGSCPSFPREHSGLNQSTDPDAESLLNLGTPTKPTRTPNLLAVSDLTNRWVRRKQS